MAPLTILALLAAGVSGSAVPAPVHVPAKAVSPAQATARILSGARVALGESIQPGDHKVTAARITAEDGRRYPAKLVEFQ